MGIGDCVDASYAGAAAKVTVTINVRSSNGSKFPVQTSLDVTIASLKEVVAGNSGVPKGLQRLIYKGRILKDDQTLESYGMEADHTIHLVRGAAPSACSNPPAVTRVTTTASTNPTNNNETGPRNLISSEGGGGLGTAGFGGIPFPGHDFLGGSGASGLFGGGHQDINQVQQGLAQNPDMMREIMNMPAMQDFLNNPDIMRNLIMNNPQTREIIDRHPDLAHVLNDPSVLRQALDAARNPELMREMMRNTDRAMSNIESSPEGFNALRRMHETVHEPFLNPTNMGGDSGTDVGSNPFAALLGNQPAVRTSDLLANPSTTGSEGLSPPNSNPLPNPWNARAGQANNSRPGPAGGDARPPGITGLGGLGLPDMQQMSGVPQDLAAFERILENPAMMQMMQSFISNPQYMEQVLNQVDPSGSLSSNTQMREMMQNPEFIQLLTSPENLRQVHALQQSLSSLGLQQQDQEHNQAGIAGAGTPNMGLNMLMNMFGGGAGSGVIVPNTPNVPPEQLYATQLSQLQDMGFFDTQENIRALSSTSGNVHAAVEQLLEGNIDR